jgi:hypothetical protein
MNMDVTRSDTSWERPTLPNLRPSEIAANSPTFWPSHVLGIAAGTWLASMFMDSKSIYATTGAAAGREKQEPQ